MQFAKCSVRMFGNVTGALYLFFQCNLKVFAHVQDKLILSLGDNYYKVTSISLNNKKVT